MTIVERRTFQRNTAQWLNRAEAGEEILVQSRGRRPVRIGPAAAAGPAAVNWRDHFRWVRGRPHVSDREFLEATRRDR